MYLQFTLFIKFVLLLYIKCKDQYWCRSLWCRTWHCHPRCITDLLISWYTAYFSVLCPTFLGDAGLYSCQALSWMWFFRPITSKDPSWMEPSKPIVPNLFCGIPPFQHRPIALPLPCDILRITAPLFYTISPRSNSLPYAGRTWVVYNSGWIKM